MPCRDRIGRNAGFTLLEVMIATAVMAIVLTAVYRLHSQTILMSQTVRFYTLAPLLAQQRAALIESKQLREQGNSSGTFDDEFPGYSWTVALEDVTSEALGGTAKDFKRIDIKISFNGDEKTYHLRTYRILTE